MKNKTVFFYIAILTAAFSFYLYNENKTRTIKIDIDKETSEIKVFDNSTEAITSIKKNDSSFSSLAHLLETMEFKKSNSNYSHSDGYTFIFHYDGESHHASVNENGMLDFECETYKIQNNEIVSELLNIAKKNAL